MIEELIKNAWLTSSKLLNSQQKAIIVEDWESDRLILLLFYPSLANP
ncbi:MAG: hypothetical protein ACJAWX_001912 [Algoriphagus sp.]|jgi:hypothetical protein